MTIRTAKHLTITEAHPFHGRDERPKRFVSAGYPVQGNETVFEQYDPRCPLCRDPDSRGLFGQGIKSCRRCERTYSVEDGDRGLCCICERDARMGWAEA